MLDTVIRHANAMPAPTWHRLGMNHADIAVKAPAASVRAATVDATGFMDSPAPDAFDAALRTLPCAAAPAGGAADDAAGLDACALSRYQSDLANRERIGDAAGAFKTGAGRDAAAFVESIAPERVVLQTVRGAADARAVVYLEAGEGGACANALDIVLAEDSAAEVAVVFDATRAADAFLGSVLRLSLIHI